MSVATGPATPDGPTVVASVPVPIRRGRRGGITHYAVVCAGGCGHTFEIAARTFRDLRSQSRLAICEQCRRPASTVVTQAHIEFWTARFSMDEIRFMAWAITRGEPSIARASSPLVQASGTELALAASAARR